ncbi:DUF6443 domain-containing protein [Flavobacterium poyangense]|uniref:DUF6443 domain-containing protein n=1 Tax=Flavobacterium poyangense TaxID=2204302 RepID=UPI001423FCCF|nr:DUF6443 domain-containing protein [Flavobacterium sp. JXAS1]
MISKNYPYSIQIILLLFTLYAQAQTPATITKGAVNTPYIVTQNETLTATQSITLKPDTWIKAGSTFVAKIVPDAYIPYTLSNENFVFTRKFQKALTSSSGVTANSDVMDNVTYFDGLGRAMQNVSIKAAANKKDILTPIVYDNIGRQEKEYLPYTDTNESVGIYRNTASAVMGVEEYYKSNYPLDINATVPNPFSQKKFEDSPLSRVLDQAAPGKDWALGSGHEIKMQYQTNIDEDAVKYFIVSVALNNEGIYVPTITSTRDYAVGQLYKAVTKDENWIAGKDNTIEEFKNKEGQVVLKRTYNAGLPHNTYYLYDSYGNLSYVLSPKAEGGFTAPVLKDLCYQYRYDSRNRLAEKKLPGKEWEYIVYDKLDRPILTQDANLKAENKWIFTKYDAFSRPVYTGEYTNATQTTRAAVQTLANNGTALFEKKQASPVTVNATSINYSNNVFPTVGINLFTINYYDDYLSIDLDGGVPAVSYGITPITNAKGLATCSKVSILGTADWTTTVSYYDAKGRAIYNYSKNNYLGATGTIKTKLDFAGKVVETTTTHKKKTDALITIVDVYDYDHTGHLLTQKQTINNQTQEVIASNSYDNLGLLKAKAVGGKITQSRLQNVDYDYNIRGWLKNINNVNTIGTDLFAFQLNYNTAATGTPLFNGNISQTFWKTANTDTGLKSYTYSYDALNRLTLATDNSVVNPGRFNEGLSYDKNGNILSILRLGNTNPVAATFGIIDNLSYAYDSGNKLTKVEDFSESTEGFINGSNTAVEYTYDSNGNMKTDENKKIKNIDYNHLNLPTRISLSYNGNGTITYVYDALGTKLQKTVANKFEIRTTDYANGFQYNNDALQFLPQSEGYVFHNEGVFNYIYQYKDHLGNIRLSYQDKNNNGAVNTSEIVQENNYYPFGLLQKGYNNAIVGVDNKYKYNGQEFQDELGLNMTAMDYRQYDNALGRFNSIDALSEMSYSVSPFAFSYNNPIFWSDPTGLISQAFFNSLWNNSAANSATKWVNDGGGTFSNTDGSGMVDQETGEFTGFDSLRAVTVTGRRTSDGGSNLDGNIGGLAQSKAYSFGRFYEGWRSNFRTKQADGIQEWFDVLGTADPLGIVDGLNALGYLARGQNGNAAIAAIAIIPYVGDAAKGSRLAMKTAKYEKLVDGFGTRAFIKEFNNTTPINTRILFNDITQGGTKKIINTPKGTIINATMSNGSIIQLRNFSTKSGDLNHSTLEFIGTQNKWKFNY